GSHLTIRELLNRIVMAQGNALWVTTISGDDLNGTEPFWRRKGGNKDHLPVTSAWRFLPLSDIDELAREQAVVELMIDGRLERIVTIPVMLENGLWGTGGGGATVGSWSDGFSWGYGASIAKLDKDSVTLSVRLTVQPPGEDELKFDKNIQITRGR